LGGHHYFGQDDEAFGLGVRHCSETVNACSADAGGRVDTLRLPQPRKHRQAAQCAGAAQTLLLRIDRLPLVCQHLPRGRQRNKTVNDRLRGGQAQSLRAQPVQHVQARFEDGNERIDVGFRLAQRFGYGPLYPMRGSVLVGPQIGDGDSKGRVGRVENTGALQDCTVLQEYLDHCSVPVVDREIQRGFTCPGNQRHACPGCQQTVHHRVPVAGGCDMQGAGLVGICPIQRNSPAAQ
jgi:hypothetical protein